MKRYRVAVVGTGYGGSVAACRAAQAGLTTLVLEKGYGYTTFPRGEQSEWRPDLGRYGPHTIIELNSKVRSWAATVRGGGSNINAGVMIRKKNFDGWPRGISAETLAPYYDLAEHMLGATPYPDEPPYADTIKTRLMLEAAQRLGIRAFRPRVAIKWRREGESLGVNRKNRFGSLQTGCRQCAECCLPGCDYASKNTLDHNYLWEARKNGANIICGQGVEKIEPLEQGGYRLTAINPKTGEESTYEADVVILGAGSLFSTEILLRNKLHYQTLPNLSPRLGSNYTTNGCFIGFAIRAGQDLGPDGGPEITVALDIPGPDGKDQGILMFDGGFKEFSYDAFYITGRGVGLPAPLIKFLTGCFKVAEGVGLINPRTTLPFLIIGRDNAMGHLSLGADGRLRTDLDPRQNREYYARANQHMRAMAKQLNARFLPFLSWQLEGKINVPHNLGGVPMGICYEDGVVDEYGCCYGYSNLCVLDGSTFLTSLGVNPALTITAWAERAIAHILAQLEQKGCITAESLQRRTISHDS